MISTTGTSIESYLEWIQKELEKKTFGEVSIVFTVSHGNVTDVRKTSIDAEHYHFDLQKGTIERKK